MFEKKTEIKIQKGELWKVVIYFTRFTQGILGGNIHIRRVWGSSNQITKHKRQ